jgi:hypothetical protein
MAILAATSLVREKMIEIEVATNALVTMVHSGRGDARNPITATDIQEK